MYAHFEPEFEQDTDVLDEQALTQLEVDLPTTNGHARRGEQSMPLLVGLMDSAAARRDQGFGDEPDIPYDLEDLAAKRTAGGGLLDSVANMANSILGAGTHQMLYFKCSNL